MIKKCCRTGKRKNLPLVEGIINEKDELIKFSQIKKMKRLNNWRISQILNTTSKISKTGKSKNLKEKRWLRILPFFQQRHLIEFAIYYSRKKVNFLKKHYVILSYIFKNCFSNKIYSTWFHYMISFSGFIRSSKIEIGCLWQDPIFILPTNVKRFCKSLKLLPVPVPVQLS